MKEFLWSLCKKKKERKKDFPGRTLKPKQKCLCYLDGFGYPVCLLMPLQKGGTFLLVLHLYLPVLCGIYCYFKKNCQHAHTEFTELFLKKQRK